MASPHLFVGLDLVSVEDDWRFGDSRTHGMACKQLELKRQTTVVLLVLLSCHFDHCRTRSCTYTGCVHVPLPPPLSLSLGTPYTYIHDASSYAGGKYVALL